MLLLLNQHHEPHKCSNAYLRYFLSNRIYEISAENFELQGKTWASDLSISSNLKFLEGFDPNVAVADDYFRWIPVGLINDLMDSNNEAFPVNNNVSGFTFSDIQIALYNKPTTMEQFKSHLRAIYPSQTTQINQLFASYGY